jgi:DNA-binding response OmpR family regulator
VLLVHGESHRSTATRDLESSFTVERARSIREAIRSFRASKPSVVVCDVNLADGDPVDVFRVLLSEAIEVPFVVSCDDCTELERVKGLQFGIDDYICGSLSALEVRERIRALLRRSRKPPSPRSPGYVGGRLVADFEGVEIKVDDQSVDLTRREFDLLRFLVENRNRVLTRDELLDGVWRLVEVHDKRTVDTHIRKLRAKLGAVGRQIQTLPGRGYRFVERSAAITGAIELVLAVM